MPWAIRSATKCSSGSPGLVATVRESDSVFRYGSDEFVVLNDINHPQQTQYIAEKLLAAISVTATWPGMT
jgi:GGDEF domain-containing protein